MALAYSANIQNRIAGLLIGQPNSGLNTNQKALLDNTWTTGSLTAGVAYDAYKFIDQFSKYLAMAGADAIPDEWEQWFVAKTVLLFAQQMRPDRKADFERDEANAREAAIDAYLRTAITADPGATPESDVLTVANIRKYVIMYCARMQRWESTDGAPRLRPRMFVPVDIVDHAIARVLRTLWDRADWSFKKRYVTFTIATNSAVTSTLSGETFDALAVRNLYYDDSSARGSLKLQWADNDQMSRLKAYYSTTGRPEFFNIEDKSGTLTWTFAPAPDAQYTARAYVYVQSSTIPSTDDGTTEFSRFPAKFRPTIKDAVLATVLKTFDTRAGDKLWAQVENEIATLLPHFADKGRADDGLPTRDVYSDLDALAVDGLALGGAL